MSQDIEGRWIVFLEGGHPSVVIRSPAMYTPREHVAVPVVPCDDAAVERAVEAAMDAIVESTDVIADGDEPFPGWALMLAERAIVAGFRAAGAQDD